MELKTNDLRVVAGARYWKERRKAAWIVGIGLGVALILVLMGTIGNDFHRSYPKVYEHSQQIVEIDSYGQVTLDDHIMARTDDNSRHAGFTATMFVGIFLLIPAVVLFLKLSIAQNNYRNEFVDEWYKGQVR